MRCVRETFLLRLSAFRTYLLLLPTTALLGHVVLAGHAAWGQATESRLSDTTAANAFVFDTGLSNTGLSDTGLSDATAFSTTGAEEAPKSPGRATALSLGGTLLLAPAFGTGLFIGPAFGHFYAENYSRAWQGIALRGGAALAALAAAESAGSGGGGPDGDFDGLGAGLAWLAAGAGVVIGSGIYDIATAGDAAREHNREHRLKSAWIVPTVGGPQGEQIGLSVRIEL